jgi:hypothetical protein
VAWARPTVEAMIVTVIERAGVELETGVDQNEKKED